ncbi:hypothetical protein U879_16845 [Defluviimonas sp. 20V17]|nr:hypothetical protein U879_16845 [Defluviimonas sp. 20V17]
MLAVLGAGPLYLWARGAGAQHPLQRSLTVRFETHASATGWDFRPSARQIELKLGQTGLAFFNLRNPGVQAGAARAAYRVTPAAADRYLVRVACLCGQTQVLGAGERAEVPMAFYVDPAIARDPVLRGIREITLSYSFTKADFPAGGGADVPFVAKLPAHPPPGMTKGQEHSDEGT